MELQDFTESIKKGFISEAFFDSYSMLCALFFML